MSGKIKCRRSFFEKTARRHSRASKPRHSEKAYRASPFSVCSRRFSIWSTLPSIFRVNQHFIAYSFWSQVPYPPVAVEAKDVSLETLERMAKILDDRGVGLALVALPTWEQVYSGEPYGPGFDIDFPQAYLQLFAREQGIPYLDLLPIFREHVSRTNENIYVKGDTHLNNEGHALAGWHISEWFRCCVKNQTHRQDLDRTEKPHR